MTGMKMSSLLKKRITVMEETVFLLNSLMSEIEFTGADIAKILSSVSSKTSVKNLYYLKKFSDYELYGDFHKVWRSAVEAFPYYKSEEKEKMLQLGSFLGTTDKESQLATIKLYFNYFANYREVAVNDYEKYGRISSLFGLFAGASVFILLL
ncbi:MAG: stage III sporulation protein AB [Clostridia bacterium]|nr:stage III sporulation protein AB [Clostridia bacterium]